MTDKTPSSDTVVEWVWWPTLLAFVVGAVIASTALWLLARYQEGES